jgi:hypothetical protein
MFMAPRRDENIHSQASFHFQDRNLLSVLQRWGVQMPGPAPIGSADPGMLNRDLYWIETQMLPNEDSRNVLFF